MERGREGDGGVETPPVERGRFVRTHTEAHAYTRAFVLKHTLGTYTESYDPPSRFGQDDPGENA